MNRTTTILFGFLFAVAPLAFSQGSEPDQRSPEDTLTAQQLIHWTHFQKPQPAPQPLPPRDTPVPQPDQQGQQGKPANPQTPSEETPATQSFTGKIVRDGNKYVLKVSSNATYELHGEDDLQQYENQNVKVVGTLDPGANAIRVVKIELLS